MGASRSSAKKKEDEIIRQQHIIGHSDSLSKDKINKILEQMENSVFKIVKEKSTGTGFLCLLPYPDRFNLLPVLITCYHVLGSDDIKEGNEIKLIYNGETKIINLNGRKIYTSNEKEFDITIIELKKGEFKDNYFLEIDNDIITSDELDKIFRNKSVYIIHYPGGKEAKYSVDSVKSIDCENKTIDHFCDTDEGSSGGPIINLHNYKVIGVHSGRKVNKNCNIGTILKFPIKDFYKNSKQILQISKNEIILVIEIENKEKGQKIYFLDNTEKHDNLGELNENNVKIFINDEEYQYSKYFIPTKEGLYTIRLEFNIQMKNCSYMFYKCQNLKEADLSSFDTQNVADMSFMFSFCFNLTLLTLSNLNTRKVTNMIYMFYNCSNLIELNLCYFDMINNVNTYEMLSLSDQLKKIKINKIHVDLFEDIIKKDIIISSDLDLEKKMDGILSKKSPNSFLDVISKKTTVPINKIKEEIKMHLVEFDLNDEYLIEILNNFSSETKIIFDTNKDKDSIFNCFSKIYGRSKIGCYLRSQAYDNDEVKDAFFYLNGKLEFLKNIFSFENNDFFTCGGNSINNFEFRSYKPQDSKFFFKMISDAVYIVLFIHQELRIILKIKDNFIKNPILYLDFHCIYLDEEYKMTEKYFEKNLDNINNYFEELYERSERKYETLKELIIYQIGN